LFKSLGLGLSLYRDQSARPLHEVLEVVLDAHNHGLRFPALIDYKPLLVVLDSLQNLPELGSSRESRYDFCHCFLGANGACLLSAFDLN